MMRCPNPEMEWLSSDGVKTTFLSLYLRNDAIPIEIRNPLQLDLKTCVKRFFFIFLRDRVNHLWIFCDLMFRIKIRYDMQTVTLPYKIAGLINEY